MFIFYFFANPTILPLTINFQAILQYFTQFLFVLRKLLFLFILDFSDADG